MANVWLARFRGKHGFEKLVAIKTILPEHALDDRFRKMFLDEARIASGIEHPNVAKILDLGEWHDHLYLVMEYVNGDAFSRLRRLMSKRGVKMPVQLSIRILADLCAGLHASHEQRGADGELAGVIHRDVSPQNVLIPDNGSAKLIDFGVAKARDRIGGETGGAITKGKSRYMAPEQALGQPIDRRADLFAVGAMAYEIFEGVSPYEGPNDMARLHALMTGAEVKEVRAAPHPAIEKLIVKALARDPEKRFKTALEIRGALEDAMVQLRVRATSDDVAEFFAKHAADRIAERKRIIKLALDGAAERQRIREQLEGSSMIGGPRSRTDSVVDGEQSDSDLLAVPAAPPPPPDKKHAEHAEIHVEAASLDALPVAAPAEPPPPAKVEAPPVEAAGLEPADAAEAGTPGHTAYSSTLSDDDGVAPPPPNRRRGLIAIAVAAGVAAVIGVGALVARPSRATSVAVEPPTSAHTATATTTTAAPTIAGSISPPDTTPTITETTPAPPPARSVATKPADTAKPAARPATTAKVTATTKPTGTTKKTKPTDVVIQ